MTTTANRTPLAEAVRLLALRDHSEAELTAKLTRKGFPADGIEAALAELRRRGYLNDEKLGRQLAAHYCVEGQLGLLAIRQRLESRGLPPVAVEAALTGIGEDDEYARATAAAVKRFGLKPTGGIAKIGRFLLARGFAEETVLAVLTRRYGYEDRE